MHVISTWPRIDLQNARFDKSKMTFFITHGFQNTGTDAWVFKLKEALLNRTDANVIVGDWGKGAATLNYFQAVGNLRLAARQFSNLLQYIIDQKGLNVNRLHIMGHSLGAQICAQIGKSIPGIYQITAMDPSQPLFEGPPLLRLVKEDARFVMAIHADARPFVPDLGFGFMNEVGHLDFYMNGGHGQPGCSFPVVVNIPQITQLSDFVKVPSEILEQTLLCPHGLSIDFWTESLQSKDCVFWGHNATMEAMLRGISNAATQGFFSKYLGISDECNEQNCSPMGPDAYFWPARGAFVVITRGAPPYCIYEASIVDQSAQRQFTQRLQKSFVKFIENN